MSRLRELGQLITVASKMVPGGADVQVPPQYQQPPARVYQIPGGIERVDHQADARVSGEIRVAQAPFRDNKASTQNETGWQIKQTQIDPKLNRTVKVQNGRGDIYSDIREQVNPAVQAELVDSSVSALAVLRRDEKEKEKGRVERVESVRDLLGGLDEQLQGVLGGVNPVIDTFKEMAVEDLVDAEVLEGMIQGSVESLADSFNQWLNQELPNLNPQQIKQLAKLDANELHRLRLGGLITGEDSLSKNQLDEMGSLVRGLALNGFSVDGKTNQEIFEELGVRLPKDVQGNLMLAGVAALGLGLAAYAVSGKNERLWRISQMLLVALVMVGCAPDSGSPTTSKPTAVVEAQVPPSGSDVEEVVVEEEANPTPTVPGVETVNTKETPPPVRNIPYWRAPSLEQAKIDGRGGVLPEEVQVFEDAVKAGFTELGVSVRVELKAFGEGDNYRVVALPRDTQGNVLWGYVEVDENTFGYTEWPVVIEYIDGVGYVMRTEGMSYPVIPNSNDAVAIPGGSDNTLPILVKGEVNVDGDSAYAMYWDGRVINDDGSVGKWLVIPDLRADGDGNYASVNGNLFKVDANDNLIPLGINGDEVVATEKGLVIYRDGVAAELFDESSFESYALGGGPIGIGGGMYEWNGKHWVAVEGFFERDGVVYEQQGGEVVEVKIPQEVQDITGLRSEFGKVVGDLEVVIGESGAPQMRVDDELVIAEYKDGEWRLKDFTFTIPFEELVEMVESQQVMKERYPSNWEIVNNAASDQPAGLQVVSLTGTKEVGFEVSDGKLGILILWNGGLLRIQPDFPLMRIDRPDSMSYTAIDKDGVRLETVIMMFGMLMHSSGDVWINFTTPLNGASDGVCDWLEGKASWNGKLASLCRSVPIASRPVNLGQVKKQILDQLFIPDLDKPVVESEWLQAIEKLLPDYASEVYIGK